MSSSREQTRMSAGEVEAFIAERKTLMVASLDRDGAPHLVPMWFAVRDGEIVFWTYRRSQKVLNLRRDPRLSCLVEAGESYGELRGVSMRGTATIVDDPDAVRRMGETIVLRYAGPLDDAARQAVAAAVAARAPKRVGVIFRPDHTATWDHRKLGGDS
ncbi:MAG: pyridoxamine 5'-phosphate oxidase family protein [Micromonosporaceae bacterium]